MENKRPFQFIAFYVNSLLNVIFKNKRSDVNMTNARSARTLKKIR